MRLPPSLALCIVTFTAALTASTAVAAWPVDAATLRTYIDGCNRGIADACSNLGVSYESGYPKDEATAADYYTQACNAGSDVGCYNLGLDYDKGKGVALDYVEGLRWEHKACDMGYGKACAVVGMQYYNGQGVVRDDGLATNYLGRACAKGLTEYCSGGGAK